PLILYPLATLIILIDKVHVLYYPDIVWSVACLIISISGLAVRTLVIGFVPMGTSGRNRKKQMANTLNTKGIYSTVRHPLYLGNFLMWLGLIIYIGNVWFIIIAILLFWLYYERIMFAEEEYLRQKFGGEFENWARHTPAFFPDFKKWKKPDLTFSVKKSIRREYRGLFAVILSFVYLNLLKNLTVNQNFTLSGPWTILLIIGIIFITTIHLINKKSDLLKPKSDSARSKGN
ncbi:MAG: isoprenylcysteine carboxylmethyltransferase family protein, partial [Bacteroidales bacterium]|nr:isoprenylcysteine carboxylmethyltransferase family protein [Bacteroidales bacterium]